MAGQILSAQETERRRIARELHDDFGQDLALLSVELDLLRQRPPRHAGTAKYGLRNRALRAFIDLLGIRWMKSRAIRYQATEMPRD